jgi:hypothetical protein
MELSAELVIVLLAGYVVGVPGLWWGLADLRRIPGGVWRHAAERPYHQWRTGFVGAYLICGWPVYVAVVLWWRGRERADLYVEWAELSARKRARRRAAAERAAAEPRPEPGPDPVVVLADHEDEPAPARGHADV